MLNVSSTSSQKLETNVSLIHFDLLDEPLITRTVTSKTSPPLLAPIIASTSKTELHKRINMFEGVCAADEIDRQPSTLSPL